MNATNILKRIEKIKQQLNQINSMRVGSLSQQYNVCGSPGCKCKDKINPQKHGPYNKLRVNIDGKSTTKFIKEESLTKVKKQMENYGKFIELTKEWVSLANQLADLELQK